MHCFQTNPENNQRVIYSRRIYHKDHYHISHTEEARSSAFKVLASPKSPAKQNKRKVKSYATNEQVFNFLVRHHTSLTKANFMILGKKYI